MNRIKKVGCVNHDCPQCRHVVGFVIVEMNEVRPGSFRITLGEAQHLLTSVLIVSPGYAGAIRPVYFQ